jgi:hypothetical protein
MMARLYENRPDLTNFCDVRHFFAKRIGDRPRRRTGRRDRHAGFSLRRAFRCAFWIARPSLATNRAAAGSARVSWGDFLISAVSFPAISSAMSIRPRAHIVPKPDLVNIGIGYVLSHYRQAISEAPHAARYRRACDYEIGPELRDSVRIQR